MDMYGPQNTTTLHINDPAFYPGKVTAYSNGDVVKEDISSDVVTASGRKVEKAETKSKLSGIQKLWIDFKFWLKKVGIKLDIIPRINLKTHLALYPAFKEQRNSLKPVLEELKKNPPKLNAVKGFSIQDIENRREADFKKRMDEALKDRELRPLLTSVKQVAKQTAAEERRDVIADKKQEAVANDNANRHARFAEIKARIELKAKLKHEAHEQKLQQAETNREKILASKHEKALADNKHRVEIRARAAKMAAEKIYGPEDTGNFERQILFSKFKRQEDIIELLKEKVRTDGMPFTTNSHTVTTV